MAFGVPVSAHLLESLRGTGPAVRTALESVVCPVGLVRDPSASGGPAEGGRLCDIPVVAKPGRREEGQTALVEAVLRWLDSRTELV